MAENPFIVTEPPRYAGGSESRFVDRLAFAEALAPLLPGFTVKPDPDGGSREFQSVVMVGAESRLYFQTLENTESQNA